MLCVIKGYCLFVIIHCLSVHVHVCNYLFGFILGFFFGTWLRNIENNWIHVCNCTWHTPLYPLEKKCKNICLSCWNLKCLLSNLHMKYMCIAFCTPWAFKGWFHEFWSLEFFYLVYLIYLFSALPQYRDSIKITDITIHVFLLAHWCRIVGLPYSLSGKQTPYLISFRNLSVMLHNMIVQTYYVVLLRLILFIIKTIHVIRNVGDM